MTKRGIGCQCKCCGAPIWLWDTDIETVDELHAMREKKRHANWTVMTEHSPIGCGEEQWVSADDLILLERQQSRQVLGRIRHKNARQ